MRTLVTGAGGQIGLDLLPALVDAGDEVVAFDLAGPPRNAPPAVQWVRGDVSLSSEVLDLVKTHRPQRIFHLAAVLSAVGERVPHRTWRVNVEGTRAVLEAARLFDCPQVFFASTIAVFGKGLPSPVGDDVALRPGTMYGVTKVTGELLGEYYHHAFGLDFRGVRFPGLISVTEPGGGTSDYALYMYVEGVRSGAYEAFVRPGSKIPFMYMPDAIRAMLELSAAPRERLTHCIYNVAAFSPTAEAFARAIRRRVPGVRLTFAPDPQRQAILDSWPEVFDDGCARRDWGWRPSFDLEAMSDDLIARLRAGEVLRAP